MNPDRQPPVDEHSQENGHFSQRIQQIIQLQQQVYEELRQNRFSYGFPFEDQFHRVSSPLTGRNASSKYMQLGDKVENSVFDASKPYLKISVQKNIAFQPVQNEYIINSKGLIDSKKNTNQTDIMIGRQTKQEYNGVEIYPNDIVLQENERVISRVHCRLIVKDFFKEVGDIDKLYLQALSKLQLPMTAKAILRSLLEEPKDIFIKDLASVCGTFVRVMRVFPQVAKTDQIYSIGSDSTFQIIDTHVKDTQNEPNDSFYTSITVLTNRKHVVHGLPSNKSRGLPVDLQEYERTTCDNIYKTLKACNLPFIIVKFGGSGVDLDKDHHVFFAYNIDKDSETFSIGRGQDNQVRIQSNTISRKQSRVQYIGRTRSWVFYDGAADKDSANGTWISLQTQQQKQRKEESDQFQLRNSSEIKINEFILKIQKFHGIKSKALTYQVDDLC
ncbi:hypothetical protein pb186bvf_000395 [Paramecium bursaria]